jgi:acetyltransferase-like isoleucine patch superfamily enzyme
VLLAVRCFRLRPLRARWRVEIEGDFEVVGRVWVPGAGRVRIGRGVRLLGDTAPIELRAHTGGEIRLGEGVVVEGGSSLEAMLSIHVGARTKIGPFCKIIDNHFHRVVGDRDERPESVPIVIGEGAVIGPRAILLPGAEVEPGACVGPGVVLSSRLRRTA